MPSPQRNRVKPLVLALAMIAGAGPAARQLDAGQEPARAGRLADDAIEREQLTRADADPVEQRGDDREVFNFVALQLEVGVAEFFDQARRVALHEARRSLRMTTRQRTAIEAPGDPPAESVPRDRQAVQHDRREDDPHHNRAR